MSIRSLALVGVLLLAGCPREDPLLALEGEIRGLAAGVCERDDECGALPLGAKACGGPAFFLPYSIRDDTATLMVLAERHRRLSERRLSGEGVSDCRVETPPAPACVQGRCQWLAEGVQGPQ